MKTAGTILSLISIIVVFFNYNAAAFIIGFALLMYGLSDYITKDKAMSYIHIGSGLVFILGILIIGF